MKIKLTQGHYALVDNEDFEWLNSYKWHYGASGYAIRKQWLKEDKRYITIWMHRLINDTPQGYETDHVDRNKLNNQRDNLRSATRSQNAFNVGLRPNNTSGHIGVSWNKQKHKWDSYIWKDSKKVNLGRYPTLGGAVKARIAGEQEYVL